MGAPVELPVDGSIRNPLHTDVVNSLDGTVRVRFERVDEIDGRKCAVLGLRMELACEVETVGQELSMELIFVGPVCGRGTVREKLELKGEGEVVWDVDGHHMRELSLETDLRLERQEHIDELDEGIETTTNQVWCGELAVKFDAVPSSGGK
jgi:hypothetical protein